MCISKFQLLLLSNWLSCAFEHFYGNLRTINVSLLFIIIIIIIIIIIVKQKTKSILTTLISQSTLIWTD